jgi:GNAT superfamily N-acetyltransferase
MTSITISAREEHHSNLRPLNILRDLPAVADLIELCFSDTMDSEGRGYIREMRRAGYDNSFLRWANRAAETTSLPLTGYIWEEDGRIVGNTSLVPFRHRNWRLYLIANVAVHPDYRRKGIARALTERALQHAREKNINDIWLHVRDDNPEALQLYTALGFSVQARRTSWKASTDGHAQKPDTDVTLTRRHPRFWATQQKWLTRLYPDPLAWHLHWNFAPLKPGLWGWFYLLFVDMNIRQWAATRGGELHATLSWIPTGRGESLFAGAGPRSAPEALTALLIQARRDLFYLHPNVTLDFPAGEFDDAIRAAGFKPLRTLFWMRATL